MTNIKTEKKIWVIIESPEPVAVVLDAGSELESIHVVIKFESQPRWKMECDKRKININ